MLLRSTVPPRTRTERILRRLGPEELLGMALLTALVTLALICSGVSLPSEAGALACSALAEVAVALELVLESCSSPSWLSLAGFSSFLAR